MKSAARIVLATTMVLLIPLLAMQFTDEVTWDLTDFAVAGVLLLGAGLTYEFITQKATKNTVYKAAAGVAVAASLALVWVNLAVGLIGNEGHRANLMYLGVLSLGFIGGIVARFQPRGMARALLTMAMAQAVVTGIALSFGLGNPQNEALEVILLNAVFVVLFAGSAGLFLRSAHGRNNHSAQ